MPITSPQNASIPHVQGSFKIFTSLRSLQDIKTMVNTNISLSRAPTLSGFHSITQSDFRLKAKVSRHGLLAYSMQTWGPRCIVPRCLSAKHEQQRRRACQCRGSAHQGPQCAQHQAVNYNLHRCLQKVVCGIAGYDNRWRPLPGQGVRYLVFNAQPTTRVMSGHNKCGEWHTLQTRFAQVGEKQWKNAEGRNQNRRISVST